jgi:hypothetical protein
MFFSVISEMRDPRQFNRSLFTCQSIVISTYITIGVVVYYFCGQYLSSPALGSAGLFLKKITYGVALPGLFASVILYTHLGAKLLFVRLLRGSTHLTHHTKTHWATWLGCTFFVTAVGFILAMAIPFFGSLVVLLGALFGTCELQRGFADASHVHADQRRHVAARQLGAPQDAPGRRVLAARGAQRVPHCVRDVRPDLRYGCWRQEHHRLVQGRRGQQAVQLCGQLVGRAGGWE